MAKKPSKCECPAGEKWAVPFADFLSLLLALFIALYALASVNIEKQKALKEEFVKIYSFNTLSQTLAEPQEDEESATTDKETDKEIQKNEQGKDSNFDKAMEELSQLENKNTKDGNLAEVSDGVLMTLPANLLFESGKSEITGEYGSLFLSRIAKIISMMPADTEVNIKGFAEDQEIIKNSKYQDALELSTARANNVLRELIRYKVPKDRLFSSGYGSKKTNPYQKQTGDKTNSNRKVEFEVKSTKNSENEPGIESIFEELKR